MCTKQQQASNKVKVRLFIFLSPASLRLLAHETEVEIQKGQT